MTRLGKIISFCVLFFLLMALDSCGLFFGKIVRWPNESQELGSRVLPADFRDSIFDDFLWTTPDIGSQKLDLQYIEGKQQASLSFAGDEYSLIKVGDSTLELLDRDGITLTAKSAMSDHSIYFDIDRLSIGTRLVSRHVPETVTVTETVPVQKTRTVPKTTVGANGMPTTTFETEFYTDFETRFVTKTEWKWETEYIPFVDIPVYKYYKFILDEGKQLLVYEPSSDQNSLYVQNPVYLVGHDTQKDFWGTKDVKLLFIDSDSDGFYFEPKDQVLFNVWNPYEETSSYQSISGFMDNKWYDLETLRNENFLSFSANEDYSRIKLDYTNDKYIGTEGSGKLIINNQTNEAATLIVNGKTYWSASPGESEYDTELGNFHVQLLQAGFMPYQQYCEITDEKNEVSIVYGLQEAAGVVSISNIFAESWSVEIMHNASGYEKVFFDLKEFSVPVGHVQVNIHVNGFKLTKELNIQAKEAITIDFEAEIKDL